MTKLAQRSGIRPRTPPWIGLLAPAASLHLYGDVRPHHSRCSCGPRTKHAAKSGRRSQDESVGGTSNNDDVIIMYVRATIRQNQSHVSDGIMLNRQRAPSFTGYQST